MLGVPFASSTSSGRAALWLVLRAMQRISGRTEVIIPAFVCPTVGRAVVKAGLKPILCDVDRRGFGLELASLEMLLGSNTLAVVTPHLYGYPSPVRPILDLAHNGGAMVVEDAAQAFGARMYGQYAGTIADAGVYSFGMSKVLGIGAGGVLVASLPELRWELAKTTDATRTSGKVRDLKALVKLAAIRVLTRSHHLGPIAAIWAGTMRGKDDCSDFAVTTCPCSLAATGKAMLACAAEVTSVRKQNAAYFAQQLSGFEGVALPEQAYGSEPVYLRFPIVVAEIGKKREILGRLQGQGINASEVYARASYDALRRFAFRPTACPQTEYLVERMLNLPTHPYMRDSDLANAVAAFAKVLPSQQRRRVAIA
jgi:dTDP-4-amino-4,6-dideoxygalactose transaminase